MPFQCQLTFRSTLDPKDRRGTVTLIGRDDAPSGYTGKILIRRKGTGMLEHPERDKVATYLDSLAVCLRQGNGSAETPRGADIQFAGWYRRNATTVWVIDLPGIVMPVHIADDEREDMVQIILGFARQFRDGLEP